jgi:hypothetical protein
VFGPLITSPYFYIFISLFYFIYLIYLYCFIYLVLSSIKKIWNNKKGIFINDIYFCCVGIRADCNIQCNNCVFREKPDDHACYVPAEWWGYWRKFLGIRAAHGGISGGCWGHVQYTPGFAARCLAGYASSHSQMVHRSFGDNYSIDIAATAALGRLDSGYRLYLGSGCIHFAQSANAYLVASGHGNLAGIRFRNRCVAHGTS